MLINCDCVLCIVSLFFFSSFLLFFHKCQQYLMECVMIYSHSMDTTMFPFQIKIIDLIKFIFEWRWIRKAYCNHRQPLTQSHILFNHSSQSPNTTTTHTTILTIHWSPNTDTRTHSLRRLSKNDKLLLPRMDCLLYVLCCGFEMALRKRNWPFVGGGCCWVCCKGHQQMLPLLKARVATTLNNCAELLRIASSVRP